MPILETNFTYIIIYLIIPYHREKNACKII